MLLPIPSELTQTESELTSSIAGFLEKQTNVINKDELRFLISSWVHYFIHPIWHILTNHQGRINCALTQPNDFNVPGDTLAFVELSRTTEYAEYLTASLLVASSPPPLSRSTTNYLIIDRLKEKAQCLAFQTCFPRKFRFFLEFFSFGKIVIIKNKYSSKQYSVTIKLREEMREWVMRDLNNLDPDWKCWLSQKIIEFFPAGLLEGLNERLQHYERLHHPKKLFSANAWPLIDDWKMYAAVARKYSGTKLIGTPHAVGHSWLKYFWQREYEISNLDRYLTWGWSYPSDKVQPFGSPYLAGKKFSVKSLKKHRIINSQILISSAARPTHLLEYPYTPHNFNKYIGNQINIADYISKKFTVDVIIRTRPSDLGWDLSNRIESIKNPRLKIEFQNQDFLKRIKRTKLHICDNASTAAIESLFQLHPTLIYITKDYFELSHLVQKEFDILKNAGIFHDTASSLITQLEKVINDIDEWWQSEHTQESVKKFLAIQGNSNPGLKSWYQKLLTDS